MVRLPLPGGGAITASFKLWVPYLHRNRERSLTRKAGSCVCGCCVLSVCAPSAPAALPYTVWIPKTWLGALHN